MPHLPVARRRLSHVIGCALVAASACVAASGSALADTSTLTTDAGASALVNAAQLSPGHVLERCVVVTTSTEYTSADLGMFVTANGPLANHLNVTIESGTGGSFAGCTGFAGRLVYVGTLAALAAGFDDTRPVRAGHYATGASSVTLRLRFSVQDDNSAQGLTTAASFWWLPIAAAVVVPPTTDPPEPSAEPTATTTAPVPSATPTATPVVTPTVRRTDPAPHPTTTIRPPVTTSASAGLPRPERTTAGPSTPAPVATSLAPPVGVPLTGGGGGPPPTAPPVAGPGGADPPSGIVGQLASGIATGVANAAQTISTAAAPALKGAAVTSLLILPLVLLFLLVQRWFDRRDPKLALAPSYGDPYLGFLERHHLSPPDRQGDPA